MTHETPKPCRTAVRAGLAAIAATAGHEPLANLTYTTADTAEAVAAMIGEPANRRLFVDTLLAGLTRDCVDAAADAQAAADVLARVRDEVLHAAARASGFTPSIVTGSE